MRIVYCLNSIRYLGGIQKVTIVKANALAEIPNYEVYIAVSDNKDGFLSESLSSKIHLIDLDINYYADDWKSRWNVIKGIIKKRKEHKKKLTKLFQEILPDIVVSVGQSEKNFIPTIKGPWKTIREFHFDKKYRLRQANSLFDKVLAYGGDFTDSFILKKYDKIVILTEEDKIANWKNYKNVEVIPNPLTIIPEKPSLCTSEKVIAVGRLQYQKNYSSLIRAFDYVVKKHSNWVLEIWGNGAEKNNLKTLIESLKLQNNVFLKGQTNDVPKKLQQASIFAISSVFEGFGLVIVEAMSMGLPVISYSCPCGPKDIIEDGVNGFLVEVNNEKELATKICELIENEEKRRQMGAEALRRSKDYSINNIVNKWIDLFSHLN